MLSSSEEISEYWDSEKQGSGWPPVKMAARNRKMLVRATKDKMAVSTRKLTSRFGIDHPYTVKVLKEGVAFHLRREAPASTPEQME